MEERAKAGIQKTTEFFQSLGIGTKLSEYTAAYEGTAKEISTRFTDRGWVKMGENGTLTPADVTKIVEMSY